MFLSKPDRNRATLPPSSRRCSVLGAMRAHRMTMMGLSRDLLGLFRGFSVAMGLVLALHGAVCVLAAPALAALPAMVALNAAMSLALLAIAVRAFPPPPIVTLLVATACFGAALVVR
ncbi:LIC_13387 family protein [Sorangium sp. So ce315]|uniref:LIC_13387 family protein n=1 Tax=Sorangium sp. So ce315 TaxID=3133299 RepID=UPI003F61FBA6